MRTNQREFFTQSENNKTFKEALADGYLTPVQYGLVFWEIRLIWSIEERAFIKYTSPTYSSYV